MKKIYLLGASLTIAFACNKKQPVNSENLELPATIKTETDTSKKNHSLATDTINDNLNYSIKVDEEGKIKMIF